MKLLVFLFYFIFLTLSTVIAGDIKIEFTQDDSYSIEVAKIGVGDTIQWLPKNKGHNVEFLAGPNMNALPENSNLDVVHEVTFNTPGVYLYQCTPHGNMGMLGLIVVGNNFNNLDKIQRVKLSRVSKSVLKRLSRIAKTNE